MPTMRACSNVGIASDLCEAGGCVAGDLDEQLIHPNGNSGTGADGRVRNHTLVGECSLAPHGAVTVASSRRHIRREEDVDPGERPREALSSNLEHLLRSRRPLGSTALGPQRLLKISVLPWV